jgi:hypothetical protein
VAQTDAPGANNDAATYDRIRALNAEGRAQALYFLAGTSSHGDRTYEVILEALDVAEKWQKRRESAARYKWACDF